MADSITRQRMDGFLKPSTRAEAPEPAPASTPAQKLTPKKAADPVQAIGVGLRASEAAELTALANRLGVPRSGLMAWVLRRFLADYDAGRVTVPELETVTTARLPR